MEKKVILGRKANTSGWEYLMEFDFPFGKPDKHAIAWECTRGEEGMTAQDALSKLSIYDELRVITPDSDETTIPE